MLLQNSKVPQLQQTGTYFYCLPAPKSLTAYKGGYQKLGDNSSQHGYRVKNLANSKATANVDMFASSRLNILSCFIVKQKMIVLG